MVRHVFTAGFRTISLIATIASTSTAYASDGSTPTVGVATNLAVCLGKFNSSRAYESYVDGLSTSRKHAGIALQQLLTSMRVIDPTSYLDQIAKMESTYLDDLVAEPMKARRKLSALREECDLIAAQAIAFQKALDRKDAQAEAAMFAEKQARIAMAKAAQDHRFLLERISAEAEKEKASAEHLRLVEETKSKEFERAKTLAKLEAEKAKSNQMIAEAEARKSEAQSREEEAAARRAEANQMALAAATQREDGRDAIGAAQVSLASTDVLPSSGTSMTSTKKATAEGVSFSINGKNVAIQGFSLGAGPEACENGVKKAIYSSGYGEERVAYVCKLEDGDDKTTAFYDATGNHVVLVIRRVGVNTQTTDVKSILERAAKHYGEPVFKSDGNYLVAYGDMYEPSKDGSSVRTLETGRGLLIKGEMCGTLMADCSGFNNATTMVTFTLSDPKAYAKSVIKGKDAYAASKKESAGSVSF